MLSPVAPTICSKLMYAHRFHKRLRLKKPETLNEKIMLLKLNKYRDNPLVTQCADKYLVRDYVKEVGCGDILNELIYVWDTPDDIDWSVLPESFVIKCNHGCGYNIICADKSRADYNRCITQLKKWSNTDYWRLYTELQYKGIHKKIICEKYLGELDALPVDYKVYCFNGKPLYILVCEEREHGKPHFYFFDYDWRFCPITHDGMAEAVDFSLPKPVQLDKMLEYSKRLSAPFPFVRVDFYYVNGKLIFGELTFTPSAGLDTGRLPEVDKQFGDILHI